MTQGFGFIQSRLAANLIEEGAFCHFTDPGTGDLMFREVPSADGGKPQKLRVGAWVRSTRSKAYEAHEEAVTRRAMSNNRKAKNEALKQELVIKQMKVERPNTLAVLVVAFENTGLEGIGKWTPTEEEVKALALDPHNGNYVDQMLAFAGNDSNYGIDETGNAGAGGDQTS